MSKYNLLDIHEGMGYKEFEDAKEKERLDKHPDKEMIKKVQAMMAKEKATNEGEAVNLAIEASQEKAGIKEDEEYSNHRDKLRKTMRLVFDIVRKYDLDAEDVMDELGEEFNVPFEFGRAGIKTENMIKEEEGFIEVSKDEIKMHLDQYRDGNIDGDDLANAVEEIVFSRMDESFDSLAKKLDKQKGIDKEEAGKIAGSIAAKKMAGAGKGPTAKQKKRMSETNSDDFYDELEEGAMQPGEGDLESGQTGNMDAYTEELKDGEAISMRDIIKSLRDDAKATDSEIKQYVKSLKKAGDSFDDVDDYVEDFKNYVADKSLQEHFGRFMKDYQ